MAKRFDLTRRRVEQIALTHHEVAARSGSIRGDEADSWLRVNDPYYKRRDHVGRVLVADSAKWVLEDLALEDVRGRAHNPLVYFLQAESGGPVKIGYTTGTSIILRLKTLQTGHPEVLVFRRLVRGSRSLEHQIQRHFAHLLARRDGEWFTVDDELAAVSRALR